MTGDETARAAVFYGPNTPLRIKRFRRPRLNEGEILVRVRLCTICGSDLHSYSGRRRSPVPGVLGHEVVGEVVSSVGEPRYHGIDEPIRAGDRVSWCVYASCGRCETCMRGVLQKCERLFKYGHESLESGGPFSGGLAEFVVLRPGTAVFRVPDEIPDAVAAIAGCAAATVMAAFRAENPSTINPAATQEKGQAETVLVFGAGALGLFACAYGHSRSARMFVVDPVSSRRERARLFGASEVFDPIDDAAALSQSLAGGASLVLELSGSVAALEQALAETAIGGTLILVGSVHPSPPWSISPEHLVRRLLTIRGVHNYLPEDLVEALRFLGAEGSSYPFGGIVAPPVDLEGATTALGPLTDSHFLRASVAP